MSRQVGDLSCLIAERVIMIIIIIFVILCMASKPASQPAIRQMMPLLPSFILPRSPDSHTSKLISRVHTLTWKSNRGTRDRARGDDWGAPGEFGSSLWLMVWQFGDRQS